MAGLIDLDTALAKARTRASKERTHGHHDVRTGQQLRISYIAVGRVDVVRRNAQGWYVCCTTGCEKAYRSEVKMRKHAVACQQSVGRGLQDDWQKAVNAVPLWVVHGGYARLQTLHAGHTRPHPLGHLVGADDGAVEPCAVHTAWTTVAVVYLDGRAGVADGWHVHERHGDRQGV